MLLLFPVMGQRSRCAVHCTVYNVHIEFLCFLPPPCPPPLPSPPPFPASQWHERSAGAVRRAVWPPGQDPAHVICVTPCRAFVSSGLFPSCYLKTRVLGKLVRQCCHIYNKGKSSGGLTLLYNRCCGGCIWPTILICCVNYVEKIQLYFQ